VTAGMVAAICVGMGVAALCAVTVDVWIEQATPGEGITVGVAAGLLVCWLMAGFIA
jgi:ABC-type molybdate transport system substrate-binding protein